MKRSTADFLIVVTSLALILAGGLTGYRIGLLNNEMIDTANVIERHARENILRGLLAASEDTIAKQRTTIATLQEMNMTMTETIATLREENEGLSRLWATESRGALSPVRSPVIVPTQPLFKFALNFSGHNIDTTVVFETLAISFRADTLQLTSITPLVVYAEGLYMHVTGPAGNVTLTLGRLTTLDNSMFLVEDLTIENHDTGERIVISEAILNGKTLERIGSIIIPSTLQR